MDTSGIPWPIVGPIATLVGILIGIGVGWGSMKAMVSALKLEVVNFKNLAQEVSTKVVTLEANAVHAARTLENLSQRVNELEVDVSAIKAKAHQIRTRRK